MPRRLEKGQGKKSQDELSALQSVVASLKADNEKLTGQVGLGGAAADATAAGVHADARITDAILVGIDVGPNLSVAGSLATILWLAALRRDGIRVRGVDFLRVGAFVMPPALVLALAAVVLA